MLRLKSLGQTIIEANDARVTPSAEAIFATTLYLIMEAGRPIGRDELTRMLWPGVSEAQAQHGLRQVLYKLKSYGATIKADRSSLILSPRFCSTDFAELLEPQPNSVLEALAEKIGGSFLPGYRPELSEQFATWVERQRDIVHSAVARALVAGMQAKKRVSDWAGAEQLASMCLTIDPLNEEATLTVAEAAALGGSKSKALSILNNYLKEIGDDAGEIKLPAALLRRRISEAYQDNIFVVRDAPFVGREEEMAELTRALARAQAGNGSAYVITGEPGIGKTRLVQEFTKVAALQRVSIVRVGCQSHDVRRPLSVFVDMVPKLLALPGALGCSPESMGYLKKLIALDRDEQSTERDTRNTEGIYQRVSHAVLDALDAISNECCLIVFIEDSQWMDSYSRNLYHTLSEKARHHSLLVLTTLTTASLPDTFGGRSGIRPLQLKPLEVDASAFLVDRTLSARPSTSKTFRDWCVRSGCGNPFFMVELAAHAADDGSFTTPPSLNQLIDQRLFSLSNLSRRVLQASCVLGRHSRLETIEKVLDERRMNLMESLDELVAGGFIAHDAESIVSRHALITEAALAKASSASKALLHRHAALSLESAATGSATVLWDCAEHWRQAGDHERAVDLMTICARHSLELGLPLVAAAILESAVELAGKERTVALLRECSRAFAVAGAWSDAGRVASRIVEMIKQDRGDSVVLAEAELELFLIAQRIGSLGPDTLAKISDLVASVELSVLVRLRAAIVATIVADGIQNKELADNVSVVVSTMKPSCAAEQTQFDHCLLIYYSSFGPPEQALPPAQRLIAFARDCNDYHSRALYLEHSGHAFRANGQIELARSMYIEAYEASHAHFLYHRAATAADSLVGLTLAYANVAEARRWCNRSKEEWRRSSGGVPIGESVSYESEVCIREGKLDIARDLIFGLRPYSRDLNTVRAQTRQLALETDLKISSGRSLSKSECRVLATFLPKVAHAFRNDYFVAQVIRGFVSVGDLDEASEILQRYLCRDRISKEPLSQNIYDLRKVHGIVWPAESVQRNGILRDP